MSTEPINPEVVSYLISQDRKAVERLVKDLVTETGYIESCSKNGHLSPHHLGQAVSALTELRRRLTRIEVLTEIIP